MDRLIEVGPKLALGNAYISAIGVNNNIDDIDSELSRTLLSEETPDTISLIKGSRLNQSRYIYREDPRLSIENDLPFDVWDDDERNHVNSCYILTEFFRIGLLFVNKLFQRVVEEYSILYPGRPYVILSRLEDGTLYRVMSHQEKTLFYTDDVSHHYMFDNIVTDLENLYKLVESADFNMRFIRDFSKKTDSNAGVSKLFSPTLDEEILKMRLFLPDGIRVDTVRDIPLSDEARNIVDTLKRSLEVNKNNIIANPGQIYMHTFEYPDAHEINASVRVEFYLWLATNNYTDPSIEGNKIRVKLYEISLYQIFDIDKTSLTSQYIIRPGFSVANLPWLTNVVDDYLSVDMDVLIDQAVKFTESNVNVTFNPHGYDTVREGYVPYNDSKFSNFEIQEVIQRLREKGFSVRSFRARVLTIGEYLVIPMNNRVSISIA